MNKSFGHSNNAQPSQNPPSSKSTAPEFDAGDIYWGISILSPT